MKPFIIDATATESGRRKATRDVIGAGPRAVAGLLESRGAEPHMAIAEHVLDGTVNIQSYDVLFVSGMTSDLVAVRRVVTLWRKTSKSPVVIGGPVSSSPEDAIIKAGGDLAVIGEGEKTLEKLLDLGLDKRILPEKKDLIRVLGIAYHENGKVRLNGFRPVMKREDYDRLTPSTQVIKDYPLYHAARVYVEVLRGCSNYFRAVNPRNDGVCMNCDRCRGGRLEDRYNCPVGFPPGCGYCSVPSLYGPPKSRSVDGIRSEVEALLSEGVRRVVLSASDFLDYGRDLLVEPEPLTDPRSPEPNYEAVEGLLSTLTDIEEVVKGVASIMIENIKGSLVTDRAAKILGKYLAGTPVSIGLETGSLEHSRRLGRPSTPRETLRAVAMLRKARLKPYVYFIHGLPWQTRETAADSVRAIKMSVEAGADRIILYRFKPLPMSAFSGKPMGAPALKDPFSHLIHDAARDANRKMKEELLGRNLKVVVAEPFKSNKRLLVAYPMLHGPVVLLENAGGLEGKVVEATITSVVSERMVRGRLTKVII